MIRLFKRKTQKEKLEYQFKKLMQQWHELASVNRAASDQKFFEAQQIAERINKMKNHEAA